MNTKTANYAICLWEINGDRQLCKIDRNPPYPFSLLSVEFKLLTRSRQTIPGKVELLVPQGRLTFPERSQLKKEMLRQVVGVTACEVLGATTLADFPAPAAYAAYLKRSLARANTKNEKTSQQIHDRLTEYAQVQIKRSIATQKPVAIETFSLTSKEFLPHLISAAKSLQLRWKHNKTTQQIQFMAWHPRNPNQPARIVF